MALDPAEFTTLARNLAWPSLSIYLPAHRTSPEKDQDRIRFRNLVRTACDSLEAAGMKTQDAEKACAPLRTLADDATFWRDSVSSGLAVFCSAEVFLTVTTDVAPPEQCVVGERFFLRPLLSASRGDRRFFALAIDRNGCRLFRGDAGGLEQIALEGVPASLADELRFDETQEAVQYSSVPTPAQAAGGGRPTGAVFHGHGGEKDVDKVNVERYLRKVEAAVAKLVSAEAGVPLVLLGVEYELAVYRALNTSTSLVPEQVLGATDELAQHEVRTRALGALEPYFASLTQARLAELADRNGSSLTLRDAATIVAAAASGRVKTLYFDDSAGPYGLFDRDSFGVEGICADTPRFLRESAEPSAGMSGEECGWDLVDLAAAETVLHGGDILAFSGEGSPVRGVAALLRY